MKTKVAMLVAAVAFGATALAACSSTPEETTTPVAAPAPAPVAEEPAEVTYSDSMKK